ncbi:hypothetical protein [Leptospira stimsonii]|nr:hypothetical protein [Leptospira stimsonii]
MEFCDKESEDAEKFFKAKAKFEKGVLSYFQNDYKNAEEFFAEV